MARWIIVIEVLTAATVVVDHQVTIGVVAQEIPRETRPDEVVDAGEEAQEVGTMEIHLAIAVVAVHLVVIVAVGVILVTTLLLGDTVKKKGIGSVKLQREQRRKTLLQIIHRFQRAQREAVVAVIACPHNHGSMTRWTTRKSVRAVKGAELIVAGVQAGKGALASENEAAKVAAEASRNTDPPAQVAVIVADNSH